MCYRVVVGLDFEAMDELLEESLATTIRMLGCHNGDIALKSTALEILKRNSIKMAGKKVVW